MTLKERIWKTLVGHEIAVNKLTDYHLQNIRGHLFKRLGEIQIEFDGKEFREANKELCKWLEVMNAEQKRRGK